MTEVRCVADAGHSEETVRAALAPYAEADRPYAFTKCGHVWNPAEPTAGLRKVGTSANIRSEVEASLRRLGVDRIDLYQMHCPPEDGTPLTEYWLTLLELKQAGKVRAVGLSNHNRTHLAEAEQAGHVDSLQPPFSAINRTVATAEIPWCAANGTGVIAYSPMQAGLLTGAFTRQRAVSLPADDWRAAVADFQGENLDRNLALAEALRPVAGRHGVPAVACAWTLAWPGVTGAIVGARRPEHIDGWLAAADLTLTTEDLTEITAAIENTAAGRGPSSPAASADWGGRQYAHRP